jgi:predicted dehydrogenase
MSGRIKPIGYGIIGAGIWGSLHVRTLGPDPRINLVALCDVDGDRARAVAAQHDIPKVFTSYDEMLEDAEIEAVSVATPDFAHGPAALAVVQAGRHLLVEKPMAMSVEECTAIIQAAEASGVTVMVDMHTRWSPAYYAAYTNLRSGNVGDLKYAYFRLNDSIYVPLEYISWAPKSSVLWFLGPHAIDTMRWLFDDEVRQVYCVRGEGVLNALGVDTPDFYVLTLQFERGGVAVLEHAWILSPKTPSLIDQKCEMLAERGSLYIDTSHNRWYEQYSELSAGGYPHQPFQDLVVTPVVQGRQVGFGAESIRAFADCLWEGKQPLATAIDGLRATEVIEAAIESAASGRRVDVVRRQV